MSRSIIYSGEHPQFSNVWEIHILREDGSKWQHLIPKDTLHWRAAEYGVDPADVDTLLDIAIHESYVPSARDEQMNPTLKAKALPWLWEADNTDDARKYHLQRIRGAKYQLQIKGNKALDPIRQGHKPDLELISRARQMVDVGRHEAKYGGLPVPKKQHSQIQATDFVTRMKDKSANPQSDSMGNDITITVGGK